MSYSITYNGLQLTAANGYIVAFQDGGAGVNKRVSSNLLTGQDGGVVNAVRKDMRYLELRGTVFGDSVEQFFGRRRELITAFAGNGGATLTISYWDGNTYEVEAFVNSEPQWTDRTGKRTNIDFRIGLIVPSVFMRTGSSQSFTATPVPASRGFPLPAPLPMPLGLSLGGTTIVIDNQGDTQVFPRFRIDGQIDNAVITNLTTGRSFTITTNIPDGRFVEVYREGGDDFVLLDGVTPFYQNISSSIFPIVLGNNSIRLTATSNDANALLTVIYQDLGNGV